MSEFQNKKRKSIFVKISGDLVKHDDVLEWLRQRAEHAFVTVCVGGGTDISAELDAAGIEYHFGPDGRKISSFRGRQIARDVLERNQAATQDFLAARGIHVAVIVPVLDIGTVLCHVNGDVMALLACNGYEEVFILTLKSREENKRQKMRRLSTKINVIGF